MLDEIKVQEGGQCQAGELLAADRRRQAARWSCVAEGQVARPRRRPPTTSTSATPRPPPTSRQGRVRSQRGGQPQGRPARSRRSKSEQAELKCEETELPIEKAQLEMRVAGLTRPTSPRPRPTPPSENIHRRQIHSPLDGIVVKLHRHAGEWVSRATRCCTSSAWTGCGSRASSAPPTSAPARSRTGRSRSTSTLAGGQQATFPGKVVFVKPDDRGRRRRSWSAPRCKIDKENGYWLLSPGMIAKMTIQVK